MKMESNTLKQTCFKGTGLLGGGAKQQKYLNNKIKKKCYRMKPGYFKAIIKDKKGGKKLTQEY